MMQDVEDSTDLRAVIRVGGIDLRQRGEVVQRPFHRLVIFCLSISVASESKVKNLAYLYMWHGEERNNIPGMHFCPWVTTSYTIATPTKR